jgi:hypothetical protein
VGDEISNEMYMKDRVALGKLISEESEQNVSETMNNSEGKVRVPDNNPFKKRKVEPYTEKGSAASISMADFEEQSVVLDSTPVSQESVSLKPEEILINSKGKHAKMEVNAKTVKGKCTKKNQDEEGGILKYFVRL